MNTGITPLTPTQEATAEHQALSEGYLMRLLIEIDKLGSVLTDGDPDETISSRAARAAEAGKPWGIALSKILDKVFGADHGATAQAGDLARAEQIITTETASLPIKPE